MNISTDWWMHRRLVNWCLLPLSILVYAFVCLKKLVYKMGLKKAYTAPVPLIVVGNIFVGGTGKTPLLIHLIKRLQQAKLTPGVISRGYGVKIGTTPVVSSKDTEFIAQAAEFGDEPALIFQHTRAPLACHPNRSLAVQALLATHPEVNVILSDDGLQHIALNRTIEILVEDHRGIGNGWLLPAGPLREPASKRQHVDYLLHNLGQAPFNTPQQLNSTRPSYVEMRIAAINLYPLAQSANTSCSNMGQEALIQHFKQHSLAAVCAMGNPKRFIDTLLAIGLSPAEHYFFPDHYSYQDHPFSQIHSDFIFITEKDAIKCQHTQDPRIWVVGIDIDFSSPQFIDHLIGSLHGQKIS